MFCKNKEKFSNSQKAGRLEMTCAIYIKATQFLHMKYYNLVFVIVNVKESDWYGGKTLLSEGN